MGMAHRSLGPVTFLTLGLKVMVRSQLRQNLISSIIMQIFYIVSYRNTLSDRHLYIYLASLTTLQCLKCYGIKEVKLHHPSLNFQLD